MVLIFEYICFVLYCLFVFICTLVILNRSPSCLHITNILNCSYFAYDYYFFVSLMRLPFGRQTCHRIDNAFSDFFFFAHSLTNLLVFTLFYLERILLLLLLLLLLILRSFTSNEMIILYI